MRLTLSLVHSCACVNALRFSSLSAIVQAELCLHRHDISQLYEIGIHPLKVRLLLPFEKS